MSEYLETVDVATSDNVQYSIIWMHGFLLMSVCALFSRMHQFARSPLIMVWRCAAGLIF